MLYIEYLSRLQEVRLLYTEFEKGLFRLQQVHLLYTEFEKGLFRLQ